MNLIENLLIYLAVPLTGWRLYVRLHRRMDESGVVEPPGVPLLLVFSVYGGWLMVLLVALSGAWSGLMYLVLIYVVLAAPFVMAFVTASLLPLRGVSGYHQAALMASALYVGACGAVLLLLVILLVSVG